MTVDGMSEIFRRVLGALGSSEAAEVGAGSDFFALGGDSLLATRVLSAIARECGVELTLDDLVRAPTPAALARVIESVPR